MSPSDGRYVASAVWALPGRYCLRVARLVLADGEAWGLALVTCQVPHVDLP
jgi:hypothetical protein